MSSNANYSRIMKFRNPRVAKMFAQTSNGIYKGFVKTPVTYGINHGVYKDVQDGAYVVVWEKEKCNLN